MHTTDHHSTAHPVESAGALAPTAAGAPPASRRARAATTVGRIRHGARHLASEVGQGTVEYVGLLLLMATLLAAIVAAAGQLGGKDQIGKKVVDNIGKSIDQAGNGKR